MTSTKSPASQTEASQSQSQSQIAPTGDIVADYLSKLTAGHRNDIERQSRRALDEAGLSFDAFQDTRDDRKGWRFDLAPLLIQQADWSVLEDGAIQRARMIDAALADIYGPQSLIREGILPASMLAAPEFIRAAARWEQPSEWRLFLYCVDVARRPDGVWVVLDDHVDRPEGLGWALANRIALSKAAPEMFFDISPVRLGGFFSTLRETLENGAQGDGRVTLLTAGSLDPAYFSNAYMARFLDFTLVEPGDLTARDGLAHVKTLEGLRRIDVTLRSAPSLGIDPIYAPGPSPLSPPGVLFAAKRGLTKFANMVGAGVFDGRSLAPYSTGLMRRLLNEEPILRESLHLNLADAGAQETYLGELGDWRISPSRSPVRPGGREQAVDPFSDIAPDALPGALRRNGWRHIARGKTELSLAASYDGGEGRDEIVQKPYAIRLFVVKGPNGFEVMPGGLAQTSKSVFADALPWQGDSKDVWVVGEDAEHVPPASVVLDQRRSSAHKRRLGRDLLSRVADNLYWLGRFIERSESNLRSLKLVRELITEAPRRQREPELLAELLELHLGEKGVAVSRDKAALLAGMADLVYNPTVAFGLRPSLDGVFRNASQTRAHLSRDAWRDVAALCNDPAWRGDPEAARPLTLAEPIENGIRAIAAFSGASHENLSRNFASRFLDLGRRIERGAQTVAMFQKLLIEPDEDEQTTLLTLLQLCDSFFAYRARYLTTPEPAAVLDLLALDEINPRSVAFQLAAIEKAIRGLPNDSHVRTPEHKTALSLLTDFRVMDAPSLAAIDPKTGRRANLASAMDRAEKALDLVSERLAASYFAHAEKAQEQMALSRLEATQ